MFWESFICAPQVSEAELMTPDCEVGRNFLISTISTKWNQTAAIASNCINCSSAWQSQLRRQHKVTQWLLAPNTLLAIIPCLNIGHKLPFPRQSHLTTLQPSQSTASPLGITVPYLAQGREKEATSQRSFWFHFSQTWQGFFHLLSSRCKSLQTTLTSLNIRCFCFYEHIPFPRAKWNCIQVLDQLACKEKV